MPYCIEKIPWVYLNSRLGGMLGGKGFDGFAKSSKGKSFVVPTMPPRATAPGKLQREEGHVVSLQSRKFRVPPMNMGEASTAAETNASKRFGGDISCQEAWRKLQQEQDSQLVDVRTQAEWSFVGIPDLSALAKAPLLVEWLGFPDGQPIPDFADRLRSALQAANAPCSGEESLLFLCRSGQRSRSAAMVVAQAGLGTCFNVVEGFEGCLDDQGHRCSVAGWKVSGLPWRQN